MNKYTLRPKTVEAAQWSPGVVIEGVDVRESPFFSEPAAFVLHEGGQFIVKKGDWVVWELGTLKHYTDAQFKEKYEESL